MPTETGRALSQGFAGSTTGPASALERHQTWQFRKAQGWAGTACMCQKRNEELLSFGSDPAITTWYRCQGKAAVMCTESTWSSRCMYGCVCTSQPLQGLPAHIPHCSKWGTQVARKDSKNWTEKNDLSGNLRGAMAEISTNQPRALLLYSSGLKSPGHEFVGLRIGSLSSKEKENTPMSASFLWSIQSNRKN